VVYVQAEMAASAAVITAEHAVVSLRSTVLAVQAAASAGTVVRAVSVQVAGTVVAVPVQDAATAAICVNPSFPIIQKERRPVTTKILLRVDSFFCCKAI
jgi:hypothetical protein